MRVLYDHSIFEQQTVGGVSKYFSEIISNLPVEVSPIIALKYSNNSYLEDDKLHEVMPIIDYRDEFIKGVNFKGKNI